jgi:hypothetical protein
MYRGELEVETDVYVLGHILSNLISNSRKHTYHGEVTVEFLGETDEVRSMATWACFLFSQLLGSGIRRPRHWDGHPEHRRRAALQDRGCCCSERSMLMCW